MPESLAKLSAEKREINESAIPFFHDESDLLPDPPFHDESDPLPDHFDPADLLDAEDDDVEAERHVDNDDDERVVNAEDNTTENDLGTQLSIGLEIEKSLEDEMDEDEDEDNERVQEGLVLTYMLESTLTSINPFE
ncbi:hypothetical protein HDU97_001125 [Phlyctochytrium planicorne]|nr:hypothetical protein HDU97_001125 [Phlyctochytrium planicorne]